MANRFTIRHGSGTPTTSNLLPYELGWNGTALYINNNNTIKRIGDGVYLPLAGGTITGTINRYYTATSTDPIITLRANNVDAPLFQMGHATSATGTITNGYKLVYNGAGSSPNNLFKLIAINSSSVESSAIQINENGVVTLPSTTSLDINAASSTYASNIRVTATTPTSNTNYYLTFTSGTVADTNYLLRVNSLVRVWIAANGASVYLAFGDTTHNGCLTLYSSGGKYLNLQTDTLATANRTITFPDATGTVALVSDLSAYLPLTGGTLSGNLTVHKSAPAIYAKDSANNDIYVGLIVGSGHQNHGVYSGGYAPTSSTYTADAKWVIYRNSSNQAASQLEFTAPKVYHAVWN